MSHQKSIVGLCLKDIRKCKKATNITFICALLYPGLHSSLLRLLATNYPHLCLVEDWMCEEEVTGTLPLLRKMMLPISTCRYTQNQLHQGEEGSAEPLSLLACSCQIKKMTEYRNKKEIRK